MSAPMPEPVFASLPFLSLASMLPGQAGTIGSRDSEEKCLMHKRLIACLEHVLQEKVQQ